MTIDDLRRLAHRRLPRAVHDFVEGGAGDERTVAGTGRRSTGCSSGRASSSTSRSGSRPRSSWESAWRRRSRVPDGMAGLCWPKARWRPPAPRTRRHHLYPQHPLELHDRGDGGGAPDRLVPTLRLAESRPHALLRGARAGRRFRALVLTVDVPIIAGAARPPQRLHHPARITVRNALDTLRRVGWVAPRALRPRLTLANLIGAPARPVPTS